MAENAIYKGFELVCRMATASQKDDSWITVESKKKKDTAEKKNERNKDNAVRLKFPPMNNRTGAGKNTLLTVGTQSTPRKFNLIIQLHVFVESISLAATNCLQIVQF